MSDAPSPDCGSDKKKSKHHEDNDTTKRQSRKVGEKLRRDKLKSYLSALAQEIPWICDANHKVDRSQILKLTVNYLKFHHGIKEKKLALQKWKPNFLSSDTLRQCLSEATGGFVMVVSHTGSIVFVSESISSILGHSPVNLIGVPISSILHYDDCETFSRQFEVVDENAFMYESSSLPAEQDRVQINTFKSNHRSFLVRMHILLKNNNKPQYETVHFRGKISSEDQKTGGKKVKVSDKQNIWLVAVGRLVRDRVIHELSVMGLDKLEWCSQHSMDGTVLFTDQRVSQCLGLFSKESTGHSCYKYIVPEDIQAVGISHMKIMTDNEVPHTIFRLKIPNQDTKYIVSRSVIVRDKWTREAKFISSINIIVDKTEGDQLLEEQQKKVDTLIAVTKQLSLQKDISEVPAQKESMGNSSNNACDCGTSEKPVSIEKDFESSASSTHVGPRKFGTPLLKSLLVSDLANSSNIRCTCVTETCCETSPISSGSHSISSCCPYSFNRNAWSQSTGSSQGNSGSPQIFCNEDSPIASSGESFHATNGEGGERSPYLYDEDTNCHSFSEGRPLVQHYENIVTGSIDEGLISMTEEEPSCGVEVEAICSMQRVKNWTDTLTEVEMDISRSTDLSDSPDTYSSQNNLTLQPSLFDTISTSLDGLNRNCPNLKPTNMELVQSELSHVQSDPVSNNQSFQLSDQFHETCSEQLSSVHNQNSFSMLYTKSPHPVDSNLNFQTRLPGSTNTQSSVFYSHPEQLPLHASFNSSASVDLNISQKQASYVESIQSFDQPSQGLPSLSYAKSYPEKSSIIICSEHFADQSNIPSHWSSCTHSKEIPTQESPTLSNLPSSPTLVHQQALSHLSKSAQNNQYNQLHFEQAGHTYNDISLLSTVQRRFNSDSGNGDDPLSDLPLCKQQYSQAQSGLNRCRCEIENIEHDQICCSEIGAVLSSRQSITPYKENSCSRELDEIERHNFPLVIEKEFKTSDSGKKEVLNASGDKSTQDVGKKECSAYFKLAGQLCAKHQQISKLLVSQEAILDQVQENLSLVTNTCTGSEQNGIRLHQDVCNLKAAVQEQRMQLSDLEDEFIARTSDLT